MPTIIDSLIVQLSLDPKGFDQGQKNSAEALRNLEGHARGIQQTLNNLSSQSRRTGSNIAAGAAVGATGLKNLATAGLEAFAALKTVEGLIGSIANSSNRGAAVSRAGWATGLGTHQLDTLIQAAYEAAHVPQEASINMLNAYQQRIAEQRRTGQWSQEFTELGRLGVNFSSPIEQQLQQIRGALHNRPGPETEAWVNSVGLGPWLQYLKLSQGQATSAEHRASQHSLTGDQGKELERLQTAAALVEDSVTHLWETMSAKLSKSGLSPALEGMSALIDSTSKNETAMQGLEVAAGAVATVASVTLVSALGKLVIALNSVWATPLMKLLVSGGFWRVMGPVGAFLGTMMPGTAGSQSEVDAEKKLFDEAKRRAGIGAGRGRAATPGGATPGGAPLSGQSLTGDPAVDHALRTINKYESPNGDVWNFKHGENPSYYTAGGYWQITDGNWRSYGARAGVDLSQYPHAQGAPLALQAAVAAMMYKQQGFAPWDNAHGGAMSPARIAEGLAVGAASSTNPYAAVRGAPGVKFNSKGQPYSSSLETMTPRESANVQASMAAIRAAQAAGRPWYRATNNDVDTNIGTINVHTQTTDGYGHGNAIANAIQEITKKNTLISSANSGLE